MPAVPAGDVTRHARVKKQAAVGLLPVTLATIAGNALSYLLLVLAARWLRPVEYSETVTLLNVLLVGSVPCLALQAVAARRTATGTPRGVLRLGALVGVVTALVTIAISPGVVAFLRLPSPIGVLLVALAFPFAAVQGTAQGIMQGMRRFRALAAVTFAGIFGRSALGLAGLAVTGTAAGTLAAVSAGNAAAASCLVGASPRVGAWARQSWPQARNLLAELAHASHAYGTFLLLTTADVLLARHVLPVAAAAGYAAGSVLTRIALWLPQSLVTVLFPALTDASRHGRVVARGVAALAGVGLVLVAGSLALHHQVWSLVAGDRYAADATHAWLFVLLGSCLAVTQFALVAGLAVRSAALTGLLWLTLLVEATTVLNLGAPSVGSVAGTACVVNLLAAAAGVAIRTRTRRHRLAPRPG
ncbi:MAG: hypothetical protein ACR2LF_04320 [Jatrophihabitantaceae bacterium]